MDINERNDRTKNALADALIKAMGNKPISKISIQELTDTCGIRRQTFYYHFPDIYSLLEWILERDRALFNSEQTKLLCWQEYVLMLFNFMDKNKKRYVSIVNCVGCRFVERFYRGELSGVIEKAVAYYFAGHRTDAKYVAFLCAYFTSSLTALIGRWIDGELDCTPEEIVSYLDTMVRDTVRGAELRLAGASSGE